MGYKSSVYAGCPEDGHDCRSSRCCARRGSKCFVKNDHWASCNETCMPFTHWDGPHGHGSWSVRVIQSGLAQISQLQTTSMLCTQERPDKLVTCERQGSAPRWEGGVERPVEIV